MNPGAVPGIVESDMGWDVSEDPRHDKEWTVNHLARPGREFTDMTDGRKFFVVRHTVVGSELWLLVEHKPADGEPVHDILLYYIKGYPGAGWGWKEVPTRESYSVPDYMLKANIDQERYGAWMQEVRQHRQEQRRRAREFASLQPGDVLTLGERRYSLLRNLGRQGWAVREVETGKQYRMPVAHVRKAFDREGVARPDPPPVQADPQQLALVA